MRRFSLPPLMPWPIPSDIQPIIDKSCVLNLLPVYNNKKWLDFSVFRNHGTIYGAIWRTVKFGKALEFDGVDDYVDCGDDESLSISKEITIEMWIYQRTVDEVDAQLYNRRDSSDNIQIRLIHRINTNTYKIEVPSSAAISNTLPPDWTSKWHHLVAIYISGVGGKIYIDGQDETASSTNRGDLDIPGAVNRIGGWKFYVFNGTIDEVRIYNRALTPEEIKRLFEWSKSRYIS